VIGSGALRLPLSAGSPRSVYQPPSRIERKRPEVFLRAAGAPSDRNLVDLSVDGGLAYRVSIR
jgi:hypothetical protein